MIQYLHHNTTTRFYREWDVIRPDLSTQGHPTVCPLAPLLFLLVAVILAIALLQSTQIRGLRHPGLPTQEQKLSAFVDDSTFFYTSGANAGGNVHHASFWGSLRAICTTAKRELIFLNTAVAISDFEGISVLRHLRYLEYQVGAGDLVDANWTSHRSKLLNQRCRQDNATACYHVTSSIIYSSRLLALAMGEG